MTENLEDLELQFKFQEYLFSDKVEGYIFNYQLITGDILPSYGKIYFISKDIQNFFIKVPFYHSLLIECINISDVQEYLKIKYAEGYHHYELVERFDIEEYNHLNKPKKMFLKVFIKNQAIYSKIVRDLKQIVLRNKNNRSINDVYKEMMYSEDENKFDVKTNILNIYDFDIPSEILFAEMYKIRVGCWFEFSYNGEVHIISAVNMLKIPNFRKLAFSIITTNQDYLNPDSNTDQAIMISVKTDTTNILLINQNIIKENLNELEYTYGNESNIFTIYNVSCEEDLLLKFIEIIQIYKPHILITYNGNLFDFSFIETRLLKYGLIMKNLIGITRIFDYFSCPFILHFDCFTWISKYGNIPYKNFTLEIAAKHMLDISIDNLVQSKIKFFGDKRFCALVNSIVKEVLVVYDIFNQKIFYQTFSLATIVPFPICKIISEILEFLYESILIVESLNCSLLIPSINQKTKFKIQNGKIINKLTNNTLNPFCTKEGIFRADFEHNFILKDEEFEYICKNIDIFLKDFRNEIDYNSIKTSIIDNLTKLNTGLNTKGNIYHIDIKSLYTDIILALRLQPTSFVTKNTCIRCDFYKNEFNCILHLDWQAKVDYFLLEPDEFKQVKKDVIDDYNKKYHKDDGYKLENSVKKYKTEASNYSNFDDLSTDMQKKILRNKIEDYSCEKNKKSSYKVIENFQSIVCQLEFSFMLNVLKKFKEYFILYKNNLENIKKELKENYSSENLKKSKLTSSIYWAHEYLYNSFCKYIYYEGARWYSTEMTIILDSIATEIIKNCTTLLNKFSLPLIVNSENIWTLLPFTFPQEVEFKSGKKFNFLESFINFKILKNLKQQVKWKNECKEIEDKINFNIYGPFKALIVPSTLQENNHLRSRYLALNFDGTIYKKSSLYEKKDFDFLSNLQKKLYLSFNYGNNLEECYCNLSKIIRESLDVIDNKGCFLTTNEICSLFSQYNILKNNGLEVADKNNIAFHIAQKITEIIDSQYYFNFLEDKYIISIYPLNEPIYNRTIPISVFETQENKHLIKKWCKLDKELDIREIIDWNYYKSCIEETVIKLIVLPSRGQQAGNYFPFLKVSNNVYKITTKTDLSEYLLLKKDNVNKLPSIIPIKKEIIQDKYWLYYNKIKEQNGLIKIQTTGDNYTFIFSSKKNVHKPISKTIYFKAEKIFYLGHSVKFDKKILPETNTLEKISFINDSENNVFNFLTNTLITDVYNSHVPSIFQCRFEEFKISKNLSFSVLTTFHYDNSIIYVFSKNGKYTFISNFKHSKIQNIDINDFLSKHVSGLIVINRFDKNFDTLLKLCEKYNTIVDQVHKKLFLCNFSKLLETHKNLHKEILSNIKMKQELCAYANIPFGNNDINILDYILYKNITELNGVLSHPGDESFRLYKNEKIISGYYNQYTIQFECVGSLILSILEYKFLLDQQMYQELESIEFKSLYNIIKNLFVDSSKNILGASLLLNKVENWIRRDSNLLSAKIRNMVSFLHQRYLFNIIAFFKEIKIKMVYVSCNIMCIDLEKDTKEGAAYVFDNCKKLIQEKKEFLHLNLRQLRIFEKLLIVDPNIYFYQKNGDIFNSSEIKMPIDFIKRYFDNEKLKNEYIYDLVTKVDIDVANLIITALSFKSDMEYVISNCKKLLKIDDFLESGKYLEMVILCKKCNTENILRNKCIKCMSIYEKDSIFQVIDKHFNYFINLALNHDIYCNKCSSINEKMLVEYCDCGGQYAKKDYSKEFLTILNKITDKDIKQSYKKKLKFYQINL